MRDRRPPFLLWHPIHFRRAASHASRVLFIKDGEVFHEIYRGESTDEQLYQKISDTLTMLATGGERHA